MDILNNANPQIIFDWPNLKWHLLKFKVKPELKGEKFLRILVNLQQTIRTSRSWVLGVPRWCSGQTLALSMLCPGLDSQSGNHQKKKKKENQTNKTKPPPHKILSLYLFSYSLIQLFVLTVLQNSQKFMQDKIGYIYRKLWEDLC